MNLEEPDALQLRREVAQKSRAAIENLEHTLMIDPRRARTEIAEHVGPIRVNVTEDEIVLESQKSHIASALLGATGMEGARQINVVAGARFGAIQEGSYASPTLSSH